MSEGRFCSNTTLASFEVVAHYYKHLYGGELGSVKGLMTEESYFMTIETYGLKLTFKDAEFKEKLHQIKEDPEALAWVEEKLSENLKTRKKPSVVVSSISWNGSERQAVHFTENKKDKTLYVSKEEGEWKINYYAGRKVDHG